MGIGIVEVVVSWFSALATPGLGVGGSTVAAEASAEKLLSLKGTCTGFGAEPDMT